MDWAWYCVRMRHDAGIINIFNFARSADVAKQVVLQAERAPERAVISVKKRRPPKGLS